MRLIILALIFVVALVCESLWRLRETTESKRKRILRNLGLACVSAIFVRFAFLPFEVWAADFAARSKFGLLNSFPLTDLVRVALGFVLLEYTLYWWHYLNHRIAFLWRFHNVHHTDLDLDVSTASRFHFGELAFSSIFRVVQILLIGIDVRTFLLFETCVTAFAQFHHSNLRLPERLDSWLTGLIVTPRMHGIHHSIVRDETDSNYGIIFTIWDRVHRSLKLGIPQDEIVIGVPSYRSFEENSLAGLLFIPFRKQRRWELPNGVIPVRKQTSRGSGND